MRHEEERYDLAEIARQAMIDRGLVPDFSKEALREAERLEKRPLEGDGARDLRRLLWCSIDNPDSRDLDQLTLAVEPRNEAITIYVAVADVDSHAPKGSAIDRHAHANTTTVYTPAKNFSMIPEKLSHDLTSLNPGEDRLSVVVEMNVDGNGHVTSSDCYRGLVHNHAKLDYLEVGAWLEGARDVVDDIERIDGLGALLEIQDVAAQRLRESRHEQGALDLETLEARAVMRDRKVVDLEVSRKNRARELIEDFMIAANGATARYLQSRGFATLRRVVRTPERWPRIVELASERGERLPPEPDSQALEEFLVAEKKRDPLRFPDLSLAIVKLMGKGEYVAELAGQTPIGHFGLAVRDYTHSTAPNRRYPDLVTQRMLKAALAGEKSPYTDDELHTLAEHCTAKEDAAEKAERQVRKSAAALLLLDRVGQKFDGIVTGASRKGTWVRIFQPPVEGRVVQNWDGLDVGEKTRVKLIGVDVERGHIDFARVRK